MLLYGHYALFRFSHPLFFFFFIHYLSWSKRTYKAISWFTRVLLPARVEERAGTAALPQGHEARRALRRAWIGNGHAYAAQEESSRRCRYRTAAALPGQPPPAALHGHGVPEDEQPYPLGEFPGGGAEALRARSAGAQRARRHGLPRGARDDAVDHCASSASTASPAAGRAASRLPLRRQGRESRRRWRCQCSFWCSGCDGRGWGWRRGVRGRL